MPARRSAQTSNPQGSGDGATVIAFPAVVHGARQRPDGVPGSMHHTRLAPGLQPQGDRAARPNLAQLSKAAPRIIDRNGRLNIVDNMPNDPAPNLTIPPSLPVFLAERIADDIETDVLKPGERLSEEAIARRFGVSRAPVREALRLLAQEEIVAIEPRRGARVRSYSRTELSEMFEMRAVLYGLGVELFTRRATAEMIATADQLGREVLKVGKSPNVTGEAFAAATQAVTSQLIGNCGNARLTDTFRRMTRRSFRHFAILAHSTPVHREIVMGYVRPMMDAIAARDERAAGALGRELVERNHAEVLRHLDEAGEDAGRAASSLSSAPPPAEKIREE